MELSKPGCVKTCVRDDIEAGHRIDKPSNSRELENPRQTRKPHFAELRGQKWISVEKSLKKQRYWIGLFRADVDFDVTLGEFGRYVSNGSRRVDAMCLESFNEKWEAWANAWQSQQAKVEELQTLYTQQGINMLKLQKRVDAVIIEIENMYLSGAIGFDTVKKLEASAQG